MTGTRVIPFTELGMDAVPTVGGKNASLGEMISRLDHAGISVPEGFATTADAYRAFLNHDGLGGRIDAQLAQLDVDDISQLTATGGRIRSWIIETPLPEILTREISQHYAQLGENIAVAVRSSATAEDLPEASFAGQQESFLNVRGIDNVLAAVRDVFASLFNDRAIAYRVHQGFDHAQVAISAGIQRMVRSDIGASGVAFTLDTESGFADAVFITASLGLGECVVQGAVNPDEFYVHKPTLKNNKPAITRRHLGSKLIKMVYADPNETAPVKTVDTSAEEQSRFSLTDDQVEALAGMAITIEAHYGKPMDIEWGLDGETDRLFILQARPETVQSRNHRQVLERYRLNGTGPVLCEGRSIGSRIGSGAVRVVPSVKDLDKVVAGDILVTDMTDPDWEPVMKRAGAIVTNRGGRTCHAAIIARELGIPAVVGCGKATSALTEGLAVTVSCAEGDTGRVYQGQLDFEVERIDLADMPELPFKISMNIGNPERAFDFQGLPNAGVGLARLEFIINNTIGVHPKALLNYDGLESDIKADVDRVMAGYESPVDFYVKKLAEGVSHIGAAFHPKPVIVRLSDFKSNEYANMIGGREFEPREDNPMLGFRGAARYIDPGFRDCFELECQALKFVRDDMGLTNIWLMVPFVRTLAEAEEVIALLGANGLVRGVNELKVIMMCEIPANALLADAFLEHFDGFSIGSNDLTQLALGLDRDSGDIAHLFDERNEAVKVLLHQAISACRSAGKYVGICGQGPSDHPDFARWLMDEGIESVSLNPDSVVPTWLYLAGETV
ncbi:MAG: phosphoenolpyruvate synthase [Arenicellales bacterium]|nr:phosphoenolpyruvate synthase [Arenicellales bacterium]MDP6552056.1 phosphoenolpyruvate synthase [Arenicellales bacterium]MDP6791568.1 phosphoenolpyruvate synthase [Arenicellales bacterium]MDP6918002.1 phosphoenolpyruvate synthase [Arenicellales bacterium]